MNQRDETRKFYDRIAEQSFKDWFENPALLPSLTTFVAELPKSPLILDMGCGTGGESKRLIALGARVIGVDFSEESLRFAIENVPEARFMKMDIMEMDFERASFDGVLDSGVIFHFTEDEQNSILDTIRSCLKDGGVFLSYYPIGDYEGMQEMKVSDESFHRYTRALPLESWIGQVMGRSFSRYRILDFAIARFRAVFFYK